MHICKKILLFILIFCLPALTAIAYLLANWFDIQLDDYQTQSHLAQQANVNQVLHASYQDLSALAKLYGVASSGEDFTTSSMGAIEGVAFWRYSTNGHTLNQIAKPNRLLAKLTPESSNALLFQDAPLYYRLDNQAYMLASAKLKQGDYLLAARRLDERYLNSLFSENTALAKVTLSPYFPEVPTSGPEQYYPVPSFKPSSPLQLELVFSNSLLGQLKQEAKWVPLVVWGYGFIILMIACLWFRLGIINPFKSLMNQLEELDVEAKNLKPVFASGCIEFSKLADKINELLTENRQRKERAKITLEAIKEAVILTDRQAKIVYLNPQAELLLGTSQQEALGQYLDGLFESDKAFTPAICEQILAKDQSARLDKVTLQLDSSTTVERNICSLIDSQNQITGCVVVLRDITQAEALKSQLKRRANYDSVTGLLNRAAFEAKLEKYTANAKSISTCYLDLEQFKLINDNCGHQAGDAMLTMVAETLEQVIDGQGLIGRLGGDEFALVFCNYSKQEVELALKALSQKIASLLLYRNDEHYNIGVSIGVAISDNKSAAELLKDADIACLAAKRRGNNQIHFYDAHDKELNNQRNASKWAARITQAIEHNELLLYYQPIQTLGSSNQRQRLEILLRILEPNGNILPPAQVIAAAERFKLMEAVDKDIIRKSFLWLSLHEDIWDNHCISINLSGNSLGAEGMLDYILEQQARFEVPSECICFEVTETSAIQNKVRATEMIKQLRLRGFSFALDDFGTGLASYSYLRELPVDYVKIDGCFIKSMVGNAKDHAIVKSIHDICLTMGIETVAEFVENQEIIHKLKEIGVNYAQGYAIGRPQPLEGYLPIRSAKKIA